MLLLQGGTAVYGRNPCRRPLAHLSRSRAYHVQGQHKGAQHEASGRCSVPHPNSKTFCFLGSLSRATAAAAMQTQATARPAQPWPQRPALGRQRCSALALSAGRVARASGGCRCQPELADVESPAPAGLDRRTLLLAALAGSAALLLGPIQEAHAGVQVRSLTQGVLVAVWSQSGSGRRLVGKLA